MKAKLLLVILFLIAAALIGFGYILRERKARVANTSVVPEVVPTNAPVLSDAPPHVGEIDSAHLHAPFALLINDTRISFFDETYMMKSETVHFEDSDGEIIHVHATGVTLPYFLSTLGVTLSKNCIKLDTLEEYCTNADRTLRTIVNGYEVKDPALYVLRQGDKILLNYGNDDSWNLRFKMNTFRDLPKDF